MKKYVVISANNNPDYFHYAKYQEKAWNKLGWDLIIMVTPDVNTLELEVSNPNTLICQLPDVPEIRTQTLAQMGRLYAAHYVYADPENDPLLMTCDMDLIPLSDYWKPDPDKITVFGHDLTDKTYYPMGYVAMRASKWIDKMQITNHTQTDILRDCARTYVKGQLAAYSSDWEAWWNVDWRLLTDRLQPFKDEITFIDRGRGHTGFAYGRVDRGDSMVIPVGETLIDAHCENHNVMHPDKLNKFISLFESVYGKLDN